MLSRRAWKIVLLVSFAHALVHLYELAIPSVEQEIAADYFPDSVADGKAFTGSLSNLWRLFWGLGALLAGWSVDRLGGRPMLAAYLIGCSICCFLASLSGTQLGLTSSMLLMGAFASIYHPAGLALIANETDPVNRPKALGLHGIFGSLGISLGPLIAWAAIGLGLPWRGYFSLLAIPGLFLGALFLWLSFRPTRETQTSAPTSASGHREVRDSAQWVSFGILTILALSQGFIYSAQMSFLPRYLSQTNLGELVSHNDVKRPSADSEAHHESPPLPSDISVYRTKNHQAEQGKLFASIALVIGCVGQFLAGRYARVDRLEWQIAWISLANAPFLFWMAIAEGWQRPLAASLFALVHFMHQPIYNSLIPKYASRKHRSLCFGISISVGLGCGSFGARFAGSFVSDSVIYCSLAGVALIATGIGILLAFLQRSPGQQMPSHAN